MIALLVGLASAHTCEEVGLDELASVPAPAVLLLGERHGSRPDLKRAARLVRALTDRGAPVRVALEAVHESNQSVLDAFAAGQVKRRQLRDALRWEETWGHAWRPYRKVLFADGVELTAAGLDLGPKPEDREVPVPEGYEAFLAELMGPHGHHGMSPEVQARFVTSMAWRDFRIAELSAADWSGEGYLVVLTGRGHVEGGLGTGWQLPKLQEAPVHSVVLGHEGARCGPDDRVWAD